MMDAWAGHPLATAPHQPAVCRLPVTCCSQQHGQHQAEGQGSASSDAGCGQHSDVRQPAWPNIRQGHNAGAPSCHGAVRRLLVRGQAPAALRRGAGRPLQCRCKGQQPSLPAPPSCGKAAAPRSHLRYLLTCGAVLHNRRCISAAPVLHQRGCVHRLLRQLQVLHICIQLCTSTRLGYVCIGMQSHLCPQHLCSLTWLAAASTAGVAIAISSPVHRIEKLHCLCSVEPAACR